MAGSPCGGRSANARRTRRKGGSIIESARLRRSHFLGALGAFGATCCTAGAATPSAAGRIDVHRHLSPPFYADAAKSATPQLSGALRGWTPATSLADMDAAGIATGYLSMPSDPGIFFGDVAAARALARRSNEYMADLRRSAPGRYGFFAALPAPDIEGSLAEIAYALDVLKADGIGFVTSYDTRYLGDPSFAPLWADLNRRKAIVFVHPTLNACCKNIVPGVGQATIEYNTDTSRAIASLLFSGTAARSPDVRVIWSHAGGTMPYLIHRFEAQARDAAASAALPHGLHAELNRFYYDTAQMADVEAMTALLDLVPLSQVLFGTDYPYAPSLENVTGLAGAGLTPDAATAIARSNAVRLFARP